MRVLIVGAGIGGTTLAYWLHRSGHEPTLIERAPELRTGGYVVDFWGAGFDVAERMGITAELVEKGYDIFEVRQVDGAGRPIASLDQGQLAGSAQGRLVTVARSDLAATIYGALDRTVETIFGESVSQIDDDGERVRVRFASGTSRDFDLVVGADGLHSTVRRMHFGPDADYEKHLGISVAAFDVPGYRPHEPHVAVAHAGVGFQALRLALRDDATIFLATFRHDGDIPEGDVEAQQQILRHHLSGARWEVPEMLRRLPDARTFYFDRASQIRMPAWSRGRVALIGDAAACPSLLAGQGSALAMVEAYVLAAALARSDDHTAAFAEYESTLASVVRTKQKAAIGLGTAFAPANRVQLFARNAIMKLMKVPLVARLAIGRSLSDPIDLPPPPTG